MLWNGLSGEALSRLDGADAPTVSAAFDPSGSLLASASADGGVRVWDVQSGRLLSILSDGASPAEDVRWSADGERIITVLRSGAALGVAPPHVVDLIALRGHGAAVVTARFSPDGERLVTASRDGTARVWETRSARARAVLRSDDETLRAAMFFGGWAKAHHSG